MRADLLVRIIDLFRHGLDVKSVEAACPCGFWAAGASFAVPHEAEVIASTVSSVKAKPVFLCVFSFFCLYASGRPR